MNKRKTKSPRAPSPPGEADYFNVKEALNQGSGHEPVVGEYARDLAEVLKLLAGHLDPHDKRKQGLQLRFVDPEGKPVCAKRKRTSPHEDEEWEGNFRQVQAAIAGANAKALAWYLLEAAEILSATGARLDPPEKHNDWQLAFVRKGRGRRSDPEKFLNDSGVARKLMMKTIEAGKQEAAIAELEDERKISRATIFRTKKGPSTKKSQKKR
jgi:hypothetical protein